MPQPTPRPTPITLLIALTCLPPLSSNAASHRQFLGFENLHEFRLSTNGSTVECWSPTYSTRVPWNELVLSWNVHLAPTQHLRLDARALWPDRSSKFYTLGLWSANPSLHPRESVNNQKDNDGNVLTDTLVLNTVAPRLQVRLTLGGGAGPHAIRFLGCSVADTRTQPLPLPPNRKAWGLILDVPRKSQLDYPGGEQEWCSPTSVSMILHYWAARLHRPELQLDVPAVAAGVLDPQWPGTGNWPFNTAFAGSLPNLRAYVTRLDDVAQLEDWIAASIPIAASLSYNLLRGRSDPGNGHLVVLAGFTDNGDVLVNDPGTRHDNVRRIFPREVFSRAWAASKNTIYVIHPLDHLPPPDPLAHWFTPRAALDEPPPNAKVSP